jgi:putative sigma-54 modulation protein
MALPLSFTGRNVEITDAMKQFITEKLEKVIYMDLATSVDCEIGQTMSHRGTEKDFYVRFLIRLPRAEVRLKKEAAEVYPLVDEMMVTLHKKMVQYKDNFQKWEGTETWPESQVIEDVVAAVDDSASAVYAGYTPKVRRKVLTEMIPMSVTEAIERMELLDKEFFVFKDVHSSKIAAVARKGGEYEMVVTA